MITDVDSNHKRSPVGCGRPAQELSKSRPSLVNVICITDQGEIESRYSSQSMKRFLQVVAVVVVGFLLVPTSIAEGLCFMFQPSVRVDMPACCSDMLQMPMHSATGMQMAASVETQSCNDDCCSVSRPTSPSQSAQDKLQLSSLLVPFDGPALADHVQSGPTFAAHITQHGLAAPLHILFRTLRI